MTETNRDGQNSGQTSSSGDKKWPFSRVRCFSAGLLVGLLMVGWVVGGTERYGEASGFRGTVRGAYRTILKGFRYTAASVKDSSSPGSSSVRNLGLGQQIETRLCQDKRLDASGIIVEVEEDGTAVLRGLVSNAAQKDTAVTLVRDTRGVERVIDHLAVPPTVRVIDTPAGRSAATGDATHTSTRQ